MKSKVFIILIILFMMSGCGSKTKTLYCTATSSEEGRTSESELRIRVKNEEVQDMRLTLNMTLSKEEKAYREMIMDQMRQKTDKVYATNEGVKAIFGMDSSYFEGFGISKEASIGEIKQVLELQGYSCK